MNRHERRAAASGANAARVADMVDRRTRANRRLTLAAEASEAIARTYEAEAAVQRVQMGITPADVSCRAGCAACCDQVVMVHELEAREIVAHYPHLLVELLPFILQRENRIMALCDELGVDIESLNILVRGQEAARHQILEAWFRLRLPCVFLDSKTKRCRVYVHRPIVCREHILVHHDPAVCDDRSGQSRINYPTTEAFVETAAPQFQAVERLGLPPRMGLLTTLVLTIINEEGLLK